MLLEIFGLPKCNLETNRVERRPEKSAEKSEERIGSNGERKAGVWEGVGWVVAAALRGGGGRFKETFWEDQ